MSTPQHDLAEVELPIAALHAHPKNARRGNVQVIAESLQTNGQYRTIVVNRGTKTGRPLEILAGHHVVQAATELLWDTVRANLVDVDEDAATRIVLVDNRSNDLAGYDDELQLALLESLPDLAGTGYLDEDRDGLRELLTEHDWEHLVDQDVLDAADEDTWPEVRCKLAPELHSLFLTVPGVEDGARVGFLVQHWSTS